MRIFTDKVKKNQELLKLAGIVQEFAANLDMQALDGLGFDWGVSTGDFSDSNGRIFKKVGEEYAYHVDPNTKAVEVWKIK